MATVVRRGRVGLAQGRTLLCRYHRLAAIACIRLKQRLVKLARSDIFAAGGAGNIALEQSNDRQQLRISRQKRVNCTPRQRNGALYCGLHQKHNSGWRLRGRGVSPRAPLLRRCCGIAAASPPAGVIASDWRRCFAHVPLRAFPSVRGRRVKLWRRLPGHRKTSRAHAAAGRGTRPRVACGRRERAGREPTLRATIRGQHRQGATTMAKTLPSRARPGVTRWLFGVLAEVPTTAWRVCWKA